MVLFVCLSINDLKIEGGLLGAHMPQLKSQDKVAGDPYDDKRHQQADNRPMVGALSNIEMFKKFRGVAEMAIRLGTGERRAVVGVNGQHGAFETVAHETYIGDPGHVRRDCVQIDKEAGEEQERNGAGWSHEDGHLNAECGSD